MKRSQLWESPGNILLFPQDEVLPEMLLLGIRSKRKMFLSSGKEIMLDIVTVGNSDYLLNVVDDGEWFDSFRGLSRRVVNQFPWVK